MGGKKVEEIEDNPTTPQDIINYLNELFTYALSIGMTYEQYWVDDPLLINSYLRAEELRTIKRNREMWLQGLYVYTAIGDLVPVLNPFSKTPKARKYLDKPIPITKKEQEDYESERITRITNKLDGLIGKKIGGF